MRLVIIRHAEPDYENNTITPKGWKEAELLANRIAKMDVTNFYVSPYGRALDTAKCTLEKMNRTAETLDWLKEFTPRIPRPDKKDVLSCSWDWMPDDWTTRPILYDAEHWFEDPIFVQGHDKEEYQMIVQNFDLLLAQHGYVREQNYYRVEKPNHDTLVFFCHFGLECVLLSHLMHVSPMPLWQGLVAAPSSVTILHTEERRKGVASFRASCFGDISHLYVADEEPSFMARYCECFEDKTTH